MSNQTSQKYYLINLSTRNVSVSTHLRAENFTLASGKCIYLGNLTDEQIIKYHRYSALNLSLRILTPDKAISILNKSINATESLKESVLGNKTQRVEHEAGFISTPIVNALQKNSIRKNNDAVNSLKKEQNDKNKQEQQVHQNTKKDEVIKDDERTVGFNEQGCDPVISEEEVKEEEPNIDDSLLPRQIDVVEENAKIELEKMSYSELYDFAKAKNISFKKKPSRQKLIEEIAATMV